MLSTPIKLLLADDHYVVLMGLSAMLRSEPNIQIVATAEDGRQAVAHYRKQRPDVAILDLRMPEMDGIEAAKAIREEFPEAKILLLTTYDTEEDVHRAVKAGVDGYVLKNASRAELIKAIMLIYQGKKWIPVEISERAEERASQPDLSARQVEVLKLMAKGLSNKDIASILGFSESGAKQHLRVIFQKLDVSDRTEAVAVAIQRGILRQE